MLAAGCSRPAAPSSSSESAVQALVADGHARLRAGDVAGAQAAASRASNTPGPYPAPTAAAVADLQAAIAFRQERWKAAAEWATTALGFHPTAGRHVLRAQANAKLARWVGSSEAARRVAVDQVRFDLAEARRLDPATEADARAVEASLTPPGGGAGR